MTKRGLPLFLVGAALVALLPAIPAQAACRPTTLADLFPNVPEPVVYPESVVVAPAGLTPTTTPPVETTTTTAPSETTTTTVPADPSVTTTVAGPPPPAPTPVAKCSYVYKMQWPVLGGGSIQSVFGQEREGGVRHHAGNDIMAPKLTPVVAVRDGVISSLNSTRGDCCWVVVDHGGGWASWYLHLNNDTSGTDDGRGIGIRPDLLQGARVVAGELIGWVGDSGNAEPGPAHLHFELRRSGVPIDPLASLRWASRHLSAPALENYAGSFNGPFFDDEGLAAETVFALLTSLGKTGSCDSWGVAICPTVVAMHQDALAWIATLGQVTLPSRSVPDPNAIIGETIDPAVLCAPIGCPVPEITVGEVNTMLLWAVHQRAQDEVMATAAADPSLPVPERIFLAPFWELDPAGARAELVGLGLANDCPMTDLPLDSLVSRAGLAEMVGQALGFLPVPACPPIL